MLTKLLAFASLYRELGPRWIIFRLAYALRLRTRLIRLQFPMGEWKAYQKHVGATSRRPDLQIPKELPPDIPWNKHTAIDEANRILGGELKYFSHQYIQTGFPPNWHTDYFSGIELDASKHWSQIPDDHVVARRAKLNEAISTNNEETASPKKKGASQQHYDIKYVWEPNRFAFVYTLVRAYAYSQDEKYPQAFWALIEHWAQHNPPNTGPNWMDGQEIALRLMAWTFGYFAFLDSPSSTPERKEQFKIYIAAQAERIYKNTSFAIFTHGNHSITEAFGLWMTGLLFPELKNAENYLSFGRMSLEREAREQIFPDGTYSMYSLNYHRFILHIYLYAIRLGDINHFPLSTQLKDSVANSITYLSQLIDLQTGEMPVYGSNDGALVLPLNNCDFTDYRPLLQLGWYITKGEFLFEPGPWDEDVFWLIGEIAGRVARSDSERRIETTKVKGTLAFPNGGIYLLRSFNSYILIRCTDFTSRPSHADQLHVDLWIHGHNLAIDAGTYLYSGELPWRNGLARTAVHNTVTVDNKDQMTMLSRFTWTDWSKGKVLKHDENVWQGEHDGYKPVSHKRTIMSLEGNRWLVIDYLTANVSHNYKLHWLLNDFPFEQKENSILLSLDEMKYKMQVGMMKGNGNFSIVRADPASTRGWRSRYYGHKEPAISVILKADSPQVTFWSFFGLESDSIKMEGNYLMANSQKIDLT
ncbi:MAG TPA: alginate lyase family protein [Anaerolineales bacterium]